MGRFHARAYSRLPQCRLLGVYDRHPQAAADTAREYGVRAYENIAQMLEQVQAVTIAVPTVYHPEVARPFLERGIACLIEKPLAADSAQARRIAEWAAQHNALVQVGHIERFNPAIVAAQRLKLHPRFIEAVRISPMTFRSLDVGVVLDMMIHDLDIVLKFAGSTVVDIDASGTSLLGKAEDICNARLRFANGCVANVTASRLALKTERRLRLFCPDMFVSVDYQKRQGVLARRQENLQSLQQALTQARSNPAAFNYADLVRLEPLETNNTDPLEAQVTAFLHSVAQGQPSAVPAADGLAAVEIAERIVHLVQSS